MLKLLASFLAKALIPIAVKIIVQFGVNEMEKKFPSLIPIIQAVLEALKGVEPEPELQKAADHYNHLISK